MIFDGVCDEVTNNDRCLYDGGDCCQVEKSSFCQDCTCKLDVDPAALQLEMESHKVVALFDQRQFIDIIVKEEGFKVQDVIDIHVCSKICMEQLLLETSSGVNAWQYFQETRVCHCASAISTFCLVTELHTYHPSIINSGNWKMVESLAFVMKARTLPCGK